MIYAFPTEAGSLIVVQADHSVEARSIIRQAGYVLPEDAEFESVGTVLVVRPIGGTDVYVAESR